VEDSVWILHAMWERPTVDPVPSFHEQRKRQVADGEIPPTVIGGVNLDDHSVTTGVQLGYVTEPGTGGLVCAGRSTEDAFPAGHGTVGAALFLLVSDQQLAGQYRATG
jgi:hypothetical protein